MDDRFDIEERRREKQASRDEDERAIAAGEKTRAEVRRENSFFGFLGVTVDYTRTGLPPAPKRSPSDP